MVHWGAPRAFCCWHFRIRWRKRLDDSVLDKVLLCLLEMDPRTFHLAAPRVCRLWKLECQRLQIPLTLRWTKDKKQTDDTLGVIASRFLSAHTMDVSGCALLSSVGIQKATKHCKQLVTISMSSCDGVSDDTLGFIADGCPSLRSLDVLSCPKVTDTGLLRIAKCCSKLDTLTASHNVTDALLLTLAECSPQLVHLAILCCAGVTDVGVETLSRGCHALTTINFHGCRSITDKGVQQLVGGCPSLTSLVLHGVTNVTDAGVEAIAMLSDLLTLDLGGTRMKDAGLEKLGMGCAELTSLDIRFCPQITEKGVQIVVTKFQKLRSLCMDGGTHMTEAAGRQLAASCLLLNKLTFYTGVCVNSANHGVDKLISGQPTFTSLDFSAKCGVTDACLKQIALMPALQELSLNSCYKVTEAGILALATDCKALKSIQVNHCSNVTDWGLSRIWSSCRHIKIKVGHR